MVIYARIRSRLQHASKQQGISNLLSEQSHRCLRLVSMHTAQTAYPMTIDLREAAVKFSLCKSLVPEDAPDDALRTANAAGTPSSLLTLFTRATPS